MRRLLTIIAGIALSILPLHAQQPQTQTAPISSVNAKYVNGVAPGYWTTAGSGLQVNVSAGTSYCGSNLVSYAGGSISVAPSTINYIYLDSTNNCAVSVKTAALAISDIPVAVVTTSSSGVSSISDARTMFSSRSSGGSGISGLTPHALAFAGSTSTTVATPLNIKDSISIPGFGLTGMTFADTAIAATSSAGNEFALFDGTGLGIYYPTGGFHRSVNVNIAGLGFYDTTIGKQFFLDDNLENTSASPLLDNYRIGVIPSTGQPGWRVSTAGHSDGPLSTICTSTNGACGGGGGGATLCPTTPYSVQVVSTGGSSTLCAPFTTESTLTQFIRNAAEVTSAGFNSSVYAANIFFHDQNRAPGNNGHTGFELDNFYTRPYYYTQGINIGNLPTHYQGWTVYKNISGDMQVNGVGIVAPDTQTVHHDSFGDTNHYLYMYSIGGFRAASDEGTAPNNFNAGEDNQTFTAPIATGATTGSTAITTTQAGSTNWNHQGQSRQVIDQTAGPLATSTITAQSIYGDCSGGKPCGTLVTLSSPLSSGAVATGVCTTTTAINTPQERMSPYGWPASVAVSCTSGSITTGNIVCIGGWFHECTTVLSAAPAWVSTTSYPYGTSVLVGGTVYVSIQDNNTNHDPGSTAGTWWNVLPAAPGGSTYITIQSRNPQPANALMFASPVGNIQLELTANTISPGSFGVGQVLRYPSDCIGATDTTHLVCGEWLGAVYQPMVNGNVTSLPASVKVWLSAQAISVKNQSTGTIDGTFVLEPNAIAWSASDVVEQMHADFFLYNSGIQSNAVFNPKNGYSGYQWAMDGSCYGDNQCTALTVSTNTPYANTIDGGGGKKGMGGIHFQDRGGIGYATAPPLYLLYSDTSPGPNNYGGGMFLGCPKAGCGADYNTIFLAAGGPGNVRDNITYNWQNRQWHFTNNVKVDETLYVQHSITGQTLFFQNGAEVIAADGGFRDGVFDGTNIGRSGLRNWYNFSNFVGDTGSYGWLTAGNYTPSTMLSANTPGTVTIDTGTAGNAQGTLSALKGVFGGSVTAHGIVSNGFDATARTTAGTYIGMDSDFASPLLAMARASSSVADSKKWDFVIFDTSLHARLYNDAGSLSNDWLIVNRTGTLATNITLAAQQHTVAGGPMVVQQNLAGGFTGWGSGIYLGWNLSSGEGESDFINGNGGAAGGFRWYNNSNTGTLNSGSSYLMHLDASSNLTIGGSMSSNHFIVSGDSTFVGANKHLCFDGDGSGNCYSQISSPSPRTLNITSASGGSMSVAIGTSLSGGSLTVQGQTVNIVGLTTSATAGAGLGSGGSVSVTGIDISHQVTINAGSDSRSHGNSVLWTGNFGHSRQHTEYCTIAPVDAASAGNMSAIFVTGSGTTNYSVSVNADGLFPGTYVYNVSCP